MEKALIIHYQEVDIKRNEHVVLYNVNFDVAEGEFVYLTGVVGSGKTSLLKTIYGELDVYSGTAEVLGRDMLSIKRRHVPALRRELGIVFQDFRLLQDRNVRCNLDFVLRATGWKDRTARADRISEVLNIVGLADKMEAMPYQLSGGEQQRVGIARAILNSPKLILADEATGNQDSESGRRTMQILFNLSQQGTAVIMATHNTLLQQQFPGTVYECRDNRLWLIERKEENPPAQEAEAVAQEAAAVTQQSESQPQGPDVSVADEDEYDDIPLATLDNNE